MIAHIRNGQLIRQYSTNSGWVVLEDGRKVSPPVAGFVDGNDKIVPMVEETNDTSTGQETISEYGGTVVFPDRVAKVTVIRDMTPEEIAARNRDVHDETCCNEVKADGFVQIFVDMNPSAVEQYIDGAVTDMASAKELLKKMGIMLLILAKRSLRDT